MGRWRTVGTLQELPEGERLGVEVDGREIALFRSGGEVLAFDDLCPHRQAPLSQMGLLQTDRVICVLHGAGFDRDSGAPLDDLAGEGIRKYPVRLRGSRIDVWIPADEGEAAGESR